MSASFPTSPGGGSKRAVWLRKLIAACKDQRVSQITGFIRRETAEGLFFDAPAIKPGKSGFRWASAGRNYDKNSSYSADEEVWIKTDNTIVTDGAVDADTGTLTYSSPGLWRCIISSAPTSGKFYVPREPWPVPDDPTSPRNHWMLIRGPVTCI